MTCPGLVRRLALGAMILVAATGSAGAAALCRPSAVVDCDAPTMRALSRLLQSAGTSTLPDLATLALIGDDPVRVAARGGMVARAFAESGDRPRAWAYLAHAQNAVFIDSDWQTNAAGLVLLAEQRHALGDPAASETLTISRIDWPSRLSVVDRVRFLGELGAGLAAIGARDEAIAQFDRARQEALAAPLPGADREHDRLTALATLWAQVRTLDGYDDYAGGLKAGIAELLAGQPDRPFWPRTLKELDPG